MNRPIASLTLILGLSVDPGMPVREILEKNDSNLVACELEELMLAINAVKYVVLDGVLVVEGETGLVVQIGHVHSLHMSLWHVCSMEQTCEFYNALAEFIATVKATRPESLIPNDLEMESFDVRSPGLVLVGALVHPIQVPAIEIFEPHVISGISLHTGKDRQACSSEGWKLKTIHWQAQMGMGSQGPQGSLAVGGEAARSHDVTWDTLQREYVLAQSPTTIETSMHSYVFVYQMVIGQVIEQSLFSVVREAVTMIEESGSVLSTAGSWYNKLMEVEYLVGRDGSQIALWLQRHKRFLRVCTALMANPEPLVKDEIVGGLDLSLLVGAHEKWRVWEKPMCVPCWAKALGRQPSVALGKLSGGSSSLVRCSVFITVSGLERRLGLFIRESQEGAVFKTKEGFAIEFHGEGLSEEIVELSREVARTFISRWDDESLHGPGSRISTSLAPSHLFVHNNNKRTLTWLPWVPKQSQTIADNISLCAIINGPELSSQCLGWMVECGCSKIAACHAGRMEDMNEHE